MKENKSKAYHLPGPPSLQKSRPLPPIQKEKEKTEKAKTEKERMDLAKEKMEKARIRAKNHVTILLKRMKDATKDSTVQDITDY